MSHGLRVVEVVAAIVHDPTNRFFVAYNPRWNQYAFPMRKVRLDQALDVTAVQALEDHCPCPIGKAQAKPLEFVGRGGASWGVGQDTFYHYHVFEVVPEKTLPAGHLASWCGFLDFDQLDQSELVSWSTKEIAGALMNNQEVAVAVICRPGPSGPEYLLVQKAPYGGFFFPATRRKTEMDASELALLAVQTDTHYRGPLRFSPDWIRETEVRQESPRYGRERQFRFHLRRITLPGVNLNDPDNPLARALDSAGVRWRWFTREQLAQPQSEPFTVTVEHLRQIVLEVDCSL